MCQRVRGESVNIDRPSLVIVPSALQGGPNVGDVPVECQCKGVWEGSEGCEA